MTPLREKGVSRAGRIIYYDWETGGFTLDEWLVHWTWKYLIDSVSLEEYQARIDYIAPAMPGALDAAPWDCHTEYLELLAANDRRSSPVR